MSTTSAAAPPSPADLASTPGTPRPAGLPPGPGALASSLGWAFRPGPTVRRLRDRYGDVFTMHIAGESAPWVLLGHPDAVKEVFTGDPRLLHAGEGNEILGPILGQSSVLLLDREPHLRQRRLLLPPFHGERLEGYRALMRELAEREVASWPRSGPFAVRPRMQELTLEIVMRTVFGLRDDAAREQLRAPLTRLLGLLSSIPTYLGIMLIGVRRAAALPPARHAVEAVDRPLLEEIARRREAEDLAERDDVLSLLLLARDEDGEPMTDRELRDELLTLLVAGHETTATALSWALERLARMPDALDRLRAEAEDGGEEFTDAVCKETLRLRPVIPTVLRQLKAPMTIAGHDLPEGVKVAPSMLLVHSREDVYPEPFRFRPERFIERPAGTYTWIPFGGGVRRCLGASFALLEMREVLQAVAAGPALRAPSGPGEWARRRSITLAPHRDGEVALA